MNSNTTNLAPRLASALDPSESSGAPWWPLVALPTGLEAALDQLLCEASFLRSPEAPSGCSINAHCIKAPLGICSFSDLKVLK